MPGGNPVIAVPGLTPTSPLITVEPVLVTVEPARTPKLPAVSRGGACAWLGEVRVVAPIRPSTAAAPRTPARFCDDVRTHAGANENLLIFPLPPGSASARSESVHRECDLNTRSIFIGASLKRPIDSPTRVLRERE